MGLKDVIRINDNFYKGNGLKELNKMNFHSSFIMLVIIYLLIAVQAIMGLEIIVNFGYFTATNIVLHGASSIVYLRNNESVHYKKFMMLAFFTTYAWLMFGYEKNIVCLLIIPALVTSILYHDILFSVVTGVLALLNNIGFVIYILVKNDFHSLQIMEGLFQVLLILLVVEAAVYATYIYNDSYSKNAEYFNMIRLKNKQLSDITLQTIETLSNAIDAKDHYTEGHSKRVSEYSVEIAKRMGIEGEELDYIKYASLLHDVGKISVPDEVLKKPAKLEGEEINVMKGHTTAGADILKMISTIPGVANSAMYHHEKYDGTGYPYGLPGEEIPKTARIIALADAYDAMTSDRVYRKRLKEEDVLNEIINNSGTQFDPEVVNAFFKYLDERKEKK